jgi:hypothetical protein
VAPVALTCRYPSASAAERHEVGVLCGHTSGVLCLVAVDELIWSGSDDTTIKVRVGHTGAGLGAFTYLPQRSDAALRSVPRCYI